MIGIVACDGVVQRRKSRVALGIHHLKEQASKTGGVLDQPALQLGDPIQEILEGAGVPKRVVQEPDRQRNPSLESVISTWIVGIRGFVKEAKLWGIGGQLIEAGTQFVKLIGIQGIEDIGEEFCDRLRFQTLDALCGVARFFDLRGSDCRHERNAND